jgi:hypothetical protein
VQEGENDSAFATGKKKIQGLVAIKTESWFRTKGMGAQKQDSENKGIR